MSWRLVVATTNPHKLRELRQIAARIAPGRLHFLAPEEVLGTPWEGIEESGRTLEENAYLKATALFERIWQPVVADDSGLEIEALGGKPGVDSAHFVGSDAENRSAVLELLRDVPPERRRARFRTVLCYRDALRTLCVEGIVEGWIALEERGTSGFGYDPLFIPEGHERTFAEMEPEEKNQLSHRFRAVAALWETLRRLEEEAVEPEGASEPEVPVWLPWLIRLSAAAARAETAAELDMLLRQALREGVPVRAIAEVLLQLCLFAGFPAAIEALTAAQAFCERFGVPWELLLPEPLETEAMRARGSELFALVYGERTERVRRRLRGGAPVLEDLVLRVAYGEVLSRSGLDIVPREWAAIAALVVGGWWRQVASHLRALLRLGFPAEQCEEFLGILQPFCTPEQWAQLCKVWQYVRQGEHTAVVQRPQEGSWCNGE